MLSSKGTISSKRVITSLAFILMGIGFISNLYWKYTIDPNIYNSMQWIVMIGLGSVASEKFSGKSVVSEMDRDGKSITNENETKTE